MKVFENIEAFHRPKEVISSDAVSDEEFQVGLRSVIDSIIPLRKDKENCIAQYERIRDELPLTKMIAEKAMPFGTDFSIGQRDIDLATLKVIYEDRYSFGYIYWYLLSRHSEDVKYDLKDPEAPYKRSLIEYANDFDLEETVNEAQRMSCDNRYNYVKGMLLKSKSTVLLKHNIKDEYELALSHLIDNYLDGLNTPPADINPHPGEMEQVTTSFDSSFASWCINAEYRPRLMKFLHEGIEGKTGNSALVFIQAAIDAEIISRPPYWAVMEEFGELCSDSNYNNYVKAAGEGSFKRNAGTLKALTNRLKEEFCRQD